MPDLACLTGGDLLRRMDQPADYHHAAGHREPMTDVGIDADNLVLLVDEDGRFRTPTA